MNPHLRLLQPYPFARLQQLFKGLTAADLAPITLSIGEPKHPTPSFIEQALIDHVSTVGQYPTTKGSTALREAIANWIVQRFLIPEINPDTQILPVNGTREALFSLAQCIVDPADKPTVVMPNPFYQIYEGAALLAGAEPVFVNTLPQNGYLPDFGDIQPEIWRRCQLLYICSPGNPSGRVLQADDHARLLELAERFNFVIAADECYSEIYADEREPPPSLLQTAYRLGHTDFKRCIVFHSLSKRSNAPGLRSGFVAGDADILRQYFLYRTYHGCAMPLAHQHASMLAWQDEGHVADNRQQYRDKFAATAEILTACKISPPPASFYLWLPTPIDDCLFAQRLFEQQHITVLPGSFLSRTDNGINPGSYHVRIALVATQSECIEAATRLNRFIHTLT